LVPGGLRVEILGGISSDVAEGVAEGIHDIQVEGTFPVG
jgi:urease gamma subunit